MEDIILIKPGSTLILQAECTMNKEGIEKEIEWFKEKMNLDVKIIDEKYKIKGIQEDG